MNAVKYKKIVLTGGPCAGKSEAMAYLKDELTNLGYKVFTVNETASELMSSGVFPEDIGRVEFQNILLRLQLKKEESYERAASLLKSEKTVIICDRGALDGKAYITDSQFASITESLSLSENDLRDRYDAVFHLRSSSKSEENIYTLENNNARSESKADASALDDRTLSCWVGHNHLRVISCTYDFADKLSNLKKQVFFFLGIPRPLEIERKYLIKYPDISHLLKNNFCKPVSIFQTYITVNGRKIRMRKRGERGGFSYYKTSKTQVNAFTRIEIEERLSEQEYNEILKEAENKISIEKIRYCIVYNDRYFELDVFDFSDKYALLEIELTDENEKVELPPFFDVLADVSADKRYRNFAIANSLSGGNIPF